MSATAYEPNDRVLDMLARAKSNAPSPTVVVEEEEEEEEEKANLIDTTTTTTTTVVTVTVATASPLVRRQFYRAVLLIELVMLLFTLGVTYGSVRTEAARQVLHNRAWIYLVVLGAVVAVMLLFVCTRRYRVCGQTGQVIVLVLTTLVFTTVLCVLTVYLKTDVFLRATLLATGLLALVVLLTFLPCCTMNSTAIVAYVLFWGLAGAILIVFIPNRWFFEHPGEDWTNPPAAVVETLLLMILAIMFAIHLIRDLHRMTGECSPTDYVHAALQIYIDMIFVFPLLYRLASNGCDHCLDIQEQAAQIRFES